MTDAASPPSLLVGADPSSIRRLYRWSIRTSIVAAVVLGMSTIAAAWFAAAIVSSTGNLVALLLPAVTLAGAVYCAYLARATTRRAAAHAARSFSVRLTEHGMDWDGGAGALTVPWDAIRSVQVRPFGRHRIVTFTLADGIGPTTPGVRSELSPALFRRLAKRGLRIGSAAIDVPVDTLLSATATLTHGRLTPR